MSNAKHMLKVSLWTGVSRILGFVRDMLVARYLGAGRLSDIFLAAFKLPNIFRNWLGEGAINVAFVPMFSEHKNDKTVAQYFASNAFSWLMLILLVITLLAEIFMPGLIWILAPGFSSVAGKMELTVLVSRIMFFYLIFICGSAMISSVLNAFSEFALTAAVPILLNVFMIGGLYLGFGAESDTTLYILAFAVVLSGLVQMWVLWRRLMQNKFGLRLIRPRLTGRVKTLFKRIGIGFIGTGFYQINVLIGTLLASFVPGAVSYLYYTDRMVQLPFAMVGLAAGTVLLTSLSDAVTKKDFKGLTDQQNRALRHTMMFIIPCMVGLIVMAAPIIKYLFEYGAWTAEATALTATAIMIQALVLPVMSTSQIYEKTLYAAQDVKTPVRTSAIALALSTAVSVALFWTVGFYAIPIGTVVGGYVRNTLLMRACRRRGLFKMARKTIIAWAGFFAMSTALGAALWAAVRAGFINGVIPMLASMAIFGIIYLPAAFMLNKALERRESCN